MLIYSLIYLALIVLLGSVIRKLLFSKKRPGMAVSLALSAVVLCGTIVVFLFLEILQIKAVAASMALPITANPKPNFTMALVSTVIFYSTLRGKRQPKTEEVVDKANSDLWHK
jgi:hypothetical protein